MRDGRGLAALAAVVIAAAGCGGDGEDGAGERLTKQELISRADEICAESNARNDDLRRRGPTSDPTVPNASEQTLRRTAETLRALATNVRDEADELRNLKPPAEAEAGFAGMIARYEEFADHLDAAAEAADDHERRALIAELSAAQRASPVRDPFPARYGFAVCGRTPEQDDAA